MEKKIGDIIEAFQNYRFQDALRQIEQFTKKIAKDNKKKSTLTDKDNHMIHIIKCGSLASMGRLHEANHIFENYFTDKIVSQISSDQAFLLSSIAQLAYDRKLLNKIQILNNNPVKNDIRLQRFMLSHRMFSGVSKSFLKQYATGKRPEDGLAQIFLEYINQLNKNHPLQQDYSRDLIIRPNKDLNLKMVQLFFMKYLTSVPDLSKLTNKKLRQSIVDLKIRLAINVNKIQQAKKHYLENIPFIQQNFVYLRSIRDAPQNKQSNIRFYLQNCGTIFRKNIQIENYVPLYDFYDEFLDFVLSEEITKDFSTVAGSLNKSSIIEQQKLYSFEGVENNIILIHYYQSLLTELNSITKGQKHQSMKKSDYYKISIKGLILQLLKINYQVHTKIYSSQQQLHSSLIKNQSFMSLLEQYFINFSKTLTYANEMKCYLPYLQERFQKLFSSVKSQNSQCTLPKVFQKNDDNLILLTNITKILVISNKDKFQSWQQVQKWASLLWKCYKKFIQQVQQSKRRQKGEVFLSDQFVIILADIVIYHIENYFNTDNKQTQPQFLQAVLTKLTAILDQVTQISPFNAYLKLRLIYVCQRLNYFDKLIDTYLSMDIKSVQFETLGYYIINPLNHFNLYTQFQNSLIRMVRSYHQNQRQTSQYCLKGLKAGTTHQVFEYFSYQKRLQKSYGKLQLFYTLFLNNRNQKQSEFYLQWIQNKLNEYKRLQKKIVFNADTKTMQNVIPAIGIKGKNVSIEQMTFNQYYGIFNNVKAFQLQIKMRRVEKLFIQAITQKTLSVQQKIQSYLKQIVQIHTQISKASSLEELFNIENQFDLIDNYLDKKSAKIVQNHKTLTKKGLSKELIFYLKLTELKINIFDTFKMIFKLIKSIQKDQNLQKSIESQNQNIIKSIQEVSGYFSSQLQWRQQVKKCWNFRQTLFSIQKLFNQLDQQASKIKKLPKSAKSLISNFCKTLQQTVLQATTNIKFQQCILPAKNVLNIQIDKNYLEKIGQRDQAIKRSITMDVKQAKKFISK